MTPETSPTKFSLWPGLRPYESHEQARFFGRQSELADLGQRIKRRTTTVLFAESGIGKTSLLKAGLIPLLRGEGLLPIYLHLDHSLSAPSLIDQVWQELDAANLLAQKHISERPESLWSWFHDTESGLLSTRNAGVTPILIFDQFEEIYTVGNSFADRKVGREEFLVQLSDLVESRVPEAIQSRLSDEDFPFDRFDFEASRYHIVISLREDYLSLLDRERERMPAVMQNRMMLDRLKGSAALDVVNGPDPTIIQPGMPERIVRYVADVSTTPLDEIEVEPSILSLVCRQLDEARGEGLISESLLEGRRGEILQRFYDSAFDGLPESARSIVEQDLVTPSGHRQSLVKVDFEAKLGEDVVASLIERRILHTEQHGRVAKIALTHDLLLPLVIKSRTEASERKIRDEAAANERKIREEAVANERASASRLKVERDKRIKFQLALVASVVVGLLAVLGLALAVVFKSDADNARIAADDANVDLQKKVDELNLTKSNLESALTAKNKAISDAEQAARKAESANKNTQRLLGESLAWAQEVVKRATSQESALGSRARLALLERAQSLFELLEKTRPQDLQIEGVDIDRQLFDVDSLAIDVHVQNIEIQPAIDRIAAAREKVEQFDAPWVVQARAQLYEKEGDLWYDRGKELAAISGRARSTRKPYEHLKSVALDAFEKSVEPYEQALSLTSGDSLNTCRILNKLANSFRELDRFDEAASTLAQSRKLLDELKPAPGESEIAVKRLNADYWNKLGNLENKSNSRAIGNAEASYQKAIELRREVLAAEPNNPNHRYELAQSIANLAFLDPKDLNLYEQRIDLARELTQAYPENSLYRRFLAEGYWTLAKGYRDKKDSSKFKHFAEQAVLVGGVENVQYLITYKEALKKSSEEKGLQPLIDLLESQNKNVPKNQTD